MPPREPRKSGYLPGLDGLRALAILGVLAAHDLPWSLGRFSNQKWRGYGGWGVELFFAISGVLICWRLLDDEAKTGNVRLRNFYVRRLFRIQPAALVYLGVVASLYLAAAVPRNWFYWWSAVFSFTNFVITGATPPGTSAFVGHFWTLSVEEHFYLLISLVFLTARKFRFFVLASLFFGLLAAQTYAESQGRYSVVDSARRTYWVIQYLLFPALLAMVVHHARVRSLVVRYGKPWVATVLVLFGMLIRVLWHGSAVVSALMHHWSPLAFVSYSLSFLFYGAGVWVIAIMLHPQSWTTKALEFPALRFMGRLSYSLYLWHIVFFVPIYLPTEVHCRTLLWLSTRPWKYVATLLTALASYFFVEKPLIRLGHKLAPPSTAGHEDLQVTPSQDSLLATVRV